MILMENTIEQLTGKEKQLYLMLFMGIIFVMLIGIILMVRAVIHESEISRTEIRICLECVT